MTYWTKEWNLYYCRFVIATAIIEHTDKGDFLVDESYGLQLELFQSNNPEAAYEYASAMVSRLNEHYRNNEGQEVQERCLGINELDLLQKNTSSLKRTFMERESITVDFLSIEEFQKIKTPEELVRNKKDFSLFDKYYNYAPDTH